MGIGAGKPRAPAAAARPFGLATVLVLASLAVLAFAGNSLIARYALAGGGITPIAFSVVRLATGAIVLAPLLLLGRGGTWNFGGGLSLFAYVAMFSWAYVELPAATGALILFAVVQATILLAGMARGERVGWLGWTGLVLSLSGLAVLLVPQVQGGRLLPSAFMAVAGIAWGAYTMIGRASAGAGRYTARSFAIGAVLALPLLAFDMTVPETRGVLLAMLSGAVTSGLGYVIWNRVSPSLGLATLATVQLATPLVAALGGIALLGELVTRELIVAGVLIVAGIGLTLRR